MLTERYLNTLNGGSSLLGLSRVVKPSPLLMLLPSSAGAWQWWILGGVLGGCWLPVMGNTREGHLALFLLRGHSQLCPFLPFVFLPCVPQCPLRVLSRLPFSDPPTEDFLSPWCSRGAAHTSVLGGCLDKPLTLWEKDSL